jgi:hypothetical protein
MNDAQGSAARPGFRHSAARSVRLPQPQKPPSHIKGLPLDAFGQLRPLAEFNLLQKRNGRRACQPSDQQCSDFSRELRLERVLAGSGMRPGAAAHTQIPLRFSTMTTIFRRAACRRAPTTLKTTELRSATSVGSILRSHITRSASSLVFSSRSAQLSAISPFLKKPWLTMYPARICSPLSNRRIDARKTVPSLPIRVC